MLFLAVFLDGKIYIFLHIDFLVVFLDGKIYIFLHYRFFSGFLDGKINYFKMLYNNFFSIKHINE